MISYSDIMEELAWKTVKPEHAWVLDKLQLALRLGHIAGPRGVEVPKPGRYIVRPTTNPFGMEGSVSFVEFEKTWTCDVPPGYFWSEIFNGPHSTVDYSWGRLMFTAIAERDSKGRFCSWKKVPNTMHKITLPQCLKSVLEQYPLANIEAIGGNIIEVHLRGNPDFLYGNSEFLPVYAGQSTVPPTGYEFINCQEENGRIGAFIR